MCTYVERLWAHPAFVVYVRLPRTDARRRTQTHALQSAPPFCGSTRKPMPSARESPVVGLLRWCVFCVVLLSRERRRARDSRKITRIHRWRSAVSGAQSLGRCLPITGPHDASGRGACRALRIVKASARTTCAPVFLVANGLAALKMLQGGGLLLELNLLRRAMRGVPSVSALMTCRRCRAGWPPPRHHTRAHAARAPQAPSAAPCAWAQLSGWCFPSSAGPCPPTSAAAGPAPPLPRGAPWPA